ncbi:hypothetical protein ACLBX9_02975 [Methylobacterium sp. A49B]
MVATVGALSRMLAAAGLDWHAVAKVIEDAGWSSEAALSDAGFQTFRWSGFQDFAKTWEDPAADRKPRPDADAPDACSRRAGLPIWGVKKIEPWWIVAGHCLQLDRAIPKAFGGKSLAKADKDRLRAIQSHGPVTNADADWIEAIVNRCHVARDAWRSRKAQTAV